MDANGLIDHRVRAVADLHVFGVPPAAHVVLLQVHVQPVDERLVLARVADEAGVELDRLAVPRRVEVDEVVGQAAAAQERRRQIARLLDGAVVDGARTQVLHRFETLRPRQVGVREDGLGKGRPL